MDLFRLKIPPCSKTWNAVKKANLPCKYSSRNNIFHSPTSKRLSYILCTSYPIVFAMRAYTRSQVIMLRGGTFFAIPHGDKNNITRRAGGAV